VWVVSNPAKTEPGSFVTHIWICHRIFLLNNRCRAAFQPTVVSKLKDHETRWDFTLRWHIKNGPTCGRNRDGVSSIVTGPRAESWSCNLLMAHGPRPWLWASSRVEGKIIRGLPNGLNYCVIGVKGGTAVAQWLRYCATNQKVAGSIPDGVNFSLA
jgi:hypothetical protein